MSVSKIVDRFFSNRDAANKPYFLMYLQFASERGVLFWVFLTMEQVVVSNDDIYHDYGS
jgi:hypothetical protein